MSEASSGRRRTGLPGWLLLPAALGLAFMAVPLIAILTRIDPADLPRLISRPESRDALLLSLQTASASTVLCLLIGTPMALLLARGRLRGLRLLRALVLLPLVMPPVVSGIALLATFGRRGLLGEELAALGIEIPFTTVAVVLAQSFVSLPFLVIALEGALRSLGDRYDVVASTLGAGPTTVLRRITLPLVLPGLASGGVLCFARALGEFGATVTFAGSLRGVTTTMPTQIYLERFSDTDSALALSVVLIAVALVIMALAGRAVTR